MLGCVLIECIDSRDIITFAKEGDTSFPNSECVFPVPVCP